MNASKIPISDLIAIYKVGPNFTEPKDEDLYEIAKAELKRRLLQADPEQAQVQVPLPLPSCRRIDFAEAPNYGYTEDCLVVIPVGWRVRQDGQDLQYSADDMINFATRATMNNGGMGLTELLKEFRR